MKETNDIVETNTLQVAPDAGLKPKSGGCGSCGTGGGCGTGQSQPKTTFVKTEEIITDVSFEERQLNLGATPDTGTFVSVMDLDLTVACNLRCTYCFKEKWNEHMEEQVAFDALLWLLHASGPVRDVGVNFMGGEPLIRFKLIQKIVPFGKRRAAQMGKNMNFGMTTNGTLVTDKVVDFWKEWGMGFHTSIDGTPEVQDRNRPMVSGQGSSRLVEKNVPKILAYRPNTTARSTVVPETAGSLVESYKYFRSLGYKDIAFVPGAPSLWNKASNDLYEEQYFEVAEMVMDEYRRGEDVDLFGLRDAIEGTIRNERYEHSCGAGRGMVLVDIHGDIWPCHRWNKASEKSWQIGNIYKHFDEMARAELDVRSQTDLLEQDCKNCVANKFCSGGCPAENLEETGKVYKRHPNACEHTRVWARAGQRVHDKLYEERNPLFLKTFYPAEVNA
jgi:uncharacterized protein